MSEGQKSTIINFPILTPRRAWYGLFVGVIAMSAWLLHAPATQAQEESNALAEVVATGFDYNPSLRGQGFGVIQAQGARSVARRAFYPSVVISQSTGNQSLKKDYKNRDGSSADDETRDGYSIQEFIGSADLPLFKGFANVSTYRAASSGVELSRQLLHARANSLAAEIAAAYYEAVAAEEILSIALSQINVLYQLRAQVNAKIQTDRGLAAARYRADSRVAAMEEEVARSRVRLANARHDLRRLIGTLPPDYALPTVVPEAALPDSLESAIALALAGHPEVLAAGRQLDQALARRRAARSGVYPSLDFSYRQNNRTNINIGPDPADKAKNRVDTETRWDVILSYNFTDAIVNTGGPVRAANAEYLAARRNVDTTRDRARARAAIAWEDYRAHITRFQAMRRFLSATVSDNESTQAQFEAGSKNLIDLINSAFELHNVRQRVIEAQVRHDLSRYALLAELGTLPSYLELTARIEALAENPDRNPPRREPPPSAPAEEASPAEDTPPEDASSDDSSDESSDESSEG